MFRYFTSNMIISYIWTKRKSVSIFNAYVLLILNIPFHKVRFNGEFVQGCLLENTKHTMLYLCCCLSMTELLLQLCCKWIDPQSWPFPEVCCGPLASQGTFMVPGRRGTIRLRCRGWISGRLSRTWPMDPTPYLICVIEIGWGRAGAGASAQPELSLPRWEGVLGVPVLSSWATCLCSQDIHSSIS